MRIAFVEDDRQLRKSVSRGLEEAGYTVDQAGTGIQLLELVDANEYAALIVDILVPEPDGITACREIRAKGNTVPILMLTALDAVEQRIAGLDAGADDYLTKPFDFGELLARLRAITRRRSDALPARIITGDVVIDTARHEVARAGRAVPLTAREYTLLVYLAQRPGRVIARAELLREVWDGSNNTYSNIIDVYAARLRKKLGDDERQPLLATVRGAGFMWNGADSTDAVTAAGVGAPIRGN
jgi:two-component system copper resistance phosphate regulon response regulator CusR